MKKVSIHTLGCRLNLSESGSIAQGFAQRGYEIVPFGEKADITFLNTCTVTDGADSSCRNTIRKAQKLSPEGKVVVAGCYAQMEPDEIRSLNVDLILGTQEKYKVFDYLDEEEGNITRIEKSNEFWGAATTLEDSRTRSFLKIQDGCNYICSFCIIPFARGRSRVISIKDAQKEARKLVEQGFKEIVLTGVNIGEYESTGGQRLVDLIKAIQDIEGLSRLRLSSVEPNTITKELLEQLKKTSQYQDHFHVPLQSADTEILTKMRRKYTFDHYKEVIGMIKGYYPNASIGADIIAGFPSESEKQFENTYNYLKNSPITHFHVFPYSKRKNTTAARMDLHIDPTLKRRRVKSLIELGKEKQSHFAQAQIGEELEILFERKGREGLWRGYSGNYLKSYFASEEDLSNKVLRLKVSKVDGSSLYF